MENGKLHLTLKWGLGLVVVGLLSDFIISAVVGAAGLLLAIAVGSVVIAGWPFFSAKLATFFLKMLRMDAAANPIPTMLDIWRDRGGRIEEAERQLKEFSGAIRSYEQDLVSLAQNYPEEAPRFQEHLQAMKLLRDKRYSAISVAKQDLAKYKDGISRAEAIWAMSQASNKLSKHAGKISGREAVAQIRSDAAIRAVEESMAQSFADLDHLIRTEVGIPPTTSSISASAPPVQLGMATQETLVQSLSSKAKVR